MKSGGAVRSAVLSFLQIAPHYARGAALDLIVSWQAHPCWVLDPGSSFILARPGVTGVECRMNINSFLTQLRLRIMSVFQAIE